MVHANATEALYRGALGHICTTVATCGGPEHAAHLRRRGCGTRSCAAPPAAHRPPAASRCCPRPPAGHRTLPPRRHRLRQNLQYLDIVHCSSKFTVQASNSRQVSGCCKKCALCRNLHVGMRRTVTASLGNEVDRQWRDVSMLGVLPRRPSTERANLTGHGLCQRVARRPLPQDRDEHVKAGGRHLYAVQRRLSKIAVKSSIQAHLLFAGWLVRVRW